VPASTPPTLLAMDYFGPAISAVLFVLIMSFVPEPARRSFNAIFAAGAVGAYLNGGFGAWELVYPALATPIVYRGLQSYRYIGVAWLMHAVWDLPHHLWGNQIWPFMRTSSFGCVIFDALIAIWFLAGAPSLIPRRPQPSSHCVEQPMRGEHDCVAAAKTAASLDLRQPAIDK
jgi:Family of unknown function (DUF6010)